MKRMIYLLFWLSLSMAAQNASQGEVTYLDSDENKTTKNNASYYEFRTELKPGIWKYQKYFINRNTSKAFLIEKYYYDSANKKQGKYTAYFIDGTLKNEGIYKDGVKHGPWKKYNKMPFVSLDSIDNSTYLIETAFFKNNKKDGHFKEFYEDGSLSGEGEYKNDHFFGECIWYYRNGQKSLAQTYDEKGKLTSIYKWDEGGKKIKINRKEDKKGMTQKDFQKYISSYIKENFNKSLYKKYPDKPYGKIYIQLTVDKMGYITLFRLKSTYKVPKEFEKEIIRIFKTIPKNKPIYDESGQALRVRYTLPLNV